LLLLSEEVFVAEALSHDQAPDAPTHGEKSGLELNPSVRIVSSSADQAHAGPPLPKARRTAGLFLVYGGAREELLLNEAALD
jgi:hypothetical protein